MSTSITVQSNDLGSLLDTLNAVPVNMYNSIGEECATARNDVVRLTKDLARAKADLASETIVVMERTARCEELAQQLEDVQSRLADLDPGDHEKNKTLFNVHDVAREYKRGHDDAKAECAQEKACAKTRLADTLYYDRVMLLHREHRKIDVIPIGFMKYKIARNIVRAFDMTETQRDIPADTVGFAAESTVSGSLLFFSPDEIVGWTALAPSEKKA